jgi:hypothetical protein
MITLNNIVKRAMSLMKTHVEYSQNLAVEFSRLIKDLEELVEAPEDIVVDAQEEVDLEAFCGVFEKLMENEPIVVLRALWPCGVEENAEEEVIGQATVEQPHENEELVGSRSIMVRTRISGRKKNVRSSTKKTLQSSINRKNNL